jgi:ankyrin repeat protein
LKTKVVSENQYGGESLIHFAAEVDENHIMMFMIENGADVNGKTTYGMETPIHRAAMSGNQDMVRLLWGCSADINAPRNGGETPLMIATENSDMPMVYLLIRLGADVKITNGNGQSASDLAQIQGSNEIFEMLSDREAGVEFPMINEFIRFKPARQNDMQSI